MDWVLFWTILILVGLGLVMVYSASSVTLQLQSSAKHAAKTAVAAGADAEGMTTAAPAGWSSRRKAVAGLGAVVLGWLLWLYSRGRLARGWALLGAVWVVFLQVTVYWMEADHAPLYALAVRQLFAALLGFAALISISQVDYRRFGNAQWAFTSLGAVIFLLIVVYFADSDKHRWFQILGTSVQPSELAKPALILFMAWFVTQRGRDINATHTVLPAALALLTLVGLVIIADFGTALVLVVTAAAIFYLGGLERRYLIGAICLGSLLLTAAIIQKPYRLKRVIDFYDPQYKYLSLIDPGERIRIWANNGSPVKDTLYQAQQSEIAVAAGGAWGRGVGNSRQKLLYLPAPFTDFIYAIVGEELGFLGAGGVLFGFLILFWRGFQLFWTATDDFGRYIAIGVTTALVFQALINVSVVLAMVPTKGIPLPLISFGGSSMVCSLLSLGLLLSVSQRAMRAA
jgi:cell division protein FtsW